MKDTVVYDYTTGWSFEKEYKIMIRHVMSTERIFNEAKLSSKSKQILIVKKLNQKLAQNYKKKSLLQENLDILVELRDSTVQILGIENRK